MGFYYHSVFKLSKRQSYNRTLCLLMHKIQIQYSRDTIHTYPGGGQKFGGGGGGVLALPLPSAKRSVGLLLQTHLWIHILLQLPTRVFSLQGYRTSTILPKQFLTILFQKCLTVWRFNIVSQIIPEHSTSVGKGLLSSGLTAP